MTGIEETYAIAVADGVQSRVIVAAGMTRGNGALFARLRQEWDQTKASIPEGDKHMRMAIVARMQTMPEARRVVLAHVTDLAGRREYEFSDGQLVALAWQALSLWLDPNCPHCAGKGFTGGYDGPQVPCRHCRQSGKKSPMVGRTERAQSLIDSAYDGICTSVAHFRGQASEKKFARDDMEDWIAEQAAL